MLSPKSMQFLHRTAAGRHTPAKACAPVAGPGGGARGAAAGQGQGGGGGARAQGWRAQRAAAPHCGRLGVRQVRTMLFQGPWDMKVWEVVVHAEALPGSTVLCLQVL